MKTLSTTVSDETFAAIRTAAVELGVSRARIIRRALALFLAHDTTLVLARMRQERQQSPIDYSDYEDTPQDIGDLPLVRRREDSYIFFAPDRLHGGPDMSDAGEESSDPRYTAVRRFREESERGEAALSAVRGG